MSISQNKSLKKTSKNAGNHSVLETVIYRTEEQKVIPFITEDRVPAGQYIAEISAVLPAVTGDGKAAVDICYIFTDAQGLRIEAKERCSIEGYRFQKYCDHLIDAGLLQNAFKISQMVGVTESVSVVYAHKNALGLLQDRKPYQGKKVIRNMSSVNKIEATGEDFDDISDDEDYDDFLEEDD